MLNVGLWMLNVVSMSDRSFLSTKPMDPRDRLIFAMDVPTMGEALAWVERLGDAVTFYKVGLEFCMGGHYFELVEELHRRGKKVFADLKFYDVPATVGGAVANLSRHGVYCVTLHGVTSIYQAAVAVRGKMKLLAVTVLTSLDANDLAERGCTMSPADVVSLRARKAVEAGIDGLICSGQEARRLREELGDQPLIITPGIRAASERGGDDQKRTMTVEEAFVAGADHIVVGRPIRKAADPRAAALAMQAEIAQLFGK
jgi:orotidine-5'-phosphate decarboxylase